MRLVVLLLLAGSVASGQIMLRPNPLDVANLSIPDPTKTYMRSGFDYNEGNTDSGNLIRVEPSGAKFTDPHSEWVLFDAQGPGVITSMWFTGRNKKGQVYLGGQMNFYFDGEHVASFSGALPALFESGAPFPKPLAERTPNGWVNYAPIYYAKSLKITISNHEDSYQHRVNARGEPIPELYHQLTYQRLPAPVHSTRIGQEKFTPWRRSESGDREEKTVEIPDTEAATVFEWQGRGILTSLRLRWLTGDPNDAILHVTCDGRRTVSLRVPELWGVNRRVHPQAKLHSLLLGFDDENDYYIYFPMPHRRSLRIEIEQPGTGGQITAEAHHLKYWPEKEHYIFHADRVTETAQPNRDIAVLRVNGPGHYVGTILELPDRVAEGDDRFYVDNEAFPPAWHGTGTEDYFRGSWSSPVPFSRPVYGLIDAHSPKTAYRFHLADRVNFTRSVVIGFEHGHRNDYFGPYRGVVFWYGPS